ncbi:MAG TPA: dockerin type I domain-containing protein, partial [Lacipirellulaceae bacterium]|nr:dockerin type I domain-containing protein [Lacipirellulaceae bacterium]
NGNVSGNSLAEPLSLPGYVNGTGTFDKVAFSGTFSPGIGPVSLNLGSVQYDGTLDIEINGSMPGSDYDQLNHNIGDGTAQLGGTLDVSLLNSFMPQAGDMFDILTAAGGISGTFDSTMLPALTGDLFWSIIYGPSRVELAVEASAPILPGDYNHNGIVDAADYIVWRNTLGQSGTGLAADGNNNGIIDAGDFDVWRAHFGQTAGSGAGAIANGSIPEPTALALLMLAAESWCLRRYRAAYQNSATH